MPPFVLALVLLSGLFTTGSPRRSLKDTKIVLRYLFFKNCPDFNGSVRLHEPITTHWQRDGSQVIDANFTSTRTIHSVHSVEVRITRCREVVSHNTCEYFSTWSWKTGICQLVRMPNMMWSRGFESIEPRLACPAKKNLYIMRNGTWDLSSVGSVFEGFVWTGTMTAKDQDEKMFMCFDGGIQAIRARRVDNQQ